MGVYRLFNYIVKEHSECLQKCFQNIPVEIELYALDLNAILHPICQQIYNYGNHKKNYLLHPHKPPTEKEVYQAICDKIEELRCIVKPIKTLYIAIDGISGICKGNQQRQRRFKSAKDSKESQSSHESTKFDSNSLTTGSLWMYNFSKYLHYYIKRQATTGNWKHLNVVFNNEKVVGEGEHKIIRYIEGKNYEKMCIHSPDADLIMLTLGLHKKGIYIFRENMYNHINCKYFLVSVDKIHEILTEKLMWKENLSNFNIKSMINDFILSTFFLGNDFLHPIPSLEIHNNGLNILFELLPIITSKKGHLTYFENGEYNINQTPLKCLILALAKKEPELLLNKWRLKMFCRDSLLDQCVIYNDDCEKGEEKEPTMNMKVYYDKYLLKTVGNFQNEGNVCEEYFKGLVFVLRYYLTGIPDWYFQFQYHYSPLFYHLYKNIEKFTNFKFILNNPLNPLEQFVALLPIRSKQIVPHELHCIYEMIPEMYPDDFQIDYEGKKNDYEGVTILPFIKVKELREAFKKCVLTDQSKLLNKLGNVICYDGSALGIEKLKL